MQPLFIETFYEDTVNRLKACPITLTELSRKSGITTRWMYYLMNNQIQEPSVRKFITLNVALDKIERDVASINRMRKELEIQLKELG
jgi:hypothetical protein